MMATEDPMPTVAEGAVGVRVLPGETLCRHGVHWIAGDLVPLLPSDAAELEAQGVVRRIHPEAADR